MVTTVKVKPTGLLKDYIKTKSIQQAYLDKLYLKTKIINNLKDNITDLYQKTDIGLRYLKCRNLGCGTCSIDRCLGLGLFVCTCLHCPFYIETNDESL